MMEEISFVDLMAMREYCMQNQPPYVLTTTYVYILEQIEEEIASRFLIFKEKEEEE